MKKRLLSAFLALAMVLTLLPVTAFAAYDANGALLTNGRAVQYKKEGDVLSGTDKAPSDGWYFTGDDRVTWYKATNNPITGVITGSSKTSGTWYQNVTDAIAANQYTVTLIGNTSEGADLQPASSLTVDLNGYTWSIAGALQALDGAAQAGCSQLNIKDTSATSGTFTPNNGIVVGRSAANGGKTTQITLTNINMTGDISVHQASASNVTLENTKAPGTTIWMAGVAASDAGTSTLGTVTVTGTSTLGKINLAKNVGTSTSGGKVIVKDGATVGEVVVNQASGDNAVSVSGGGKVTTRITVTQDSGNNTVSVTGSGSAGGAITVTQTTGGSVSVTSSATAGTVRLESSKNPSITVNSSATVETIMGMGDGLVVDISNYGHVTKNVVLSGKPGGSSVTAEEAASLAAPKLTVNGGIVEGNISNWQRNELLQKDYTVEIKGGGTVSGTINLYKAQISVNGGTVSGTTTLNSGVLTAGPNANMQNIVLGANVAAADESKYGPEAVMNVSGMGNTIGAINSATSNNRKLVLTIPGITDATKQNPRDNDTNKFAGVWLGDLAANNVDTDRSYIAGGHYKSALEGAKALLTPGITYVVEEDATGKWEDYKFSYWGNSVNLINTLTGMTSIARNTNNNWPEIKTKDAPATNAMSVSLYAYTPRTQPDGDPVASVGTDGNTAKAVLRILFKEPANGSISTFILPSELGTNKSINWSQCTATNNDGVATITVDTSARKVVGGESIAPTSNVTYVSNALSYQVTKVLDVQTAAVGNYNATVKAKLEGNTIVLSGLAKVYGTGNSAVIPLVMETDAIEKVYVDAVWNPSDKTLFFTDPAGHPTLSVQTGGGLIIANDGGSQLLLVANNTKISLKAGNLTEDTLKNVTFQGNTAVSKGGMVTTTNRIPDSQAFGSDLKKALADAMTKPAGADGVVDFSLSPTVQQEFGSYIAKLNQNTLDGYLKKVQQDKYQEQYKKDNPGKSLTSAQLNALSPSELARTGYNTIAVVLYMNVDVTAFGNNIPYTMTATMTPYARVEIQHNNNDGTPLNWTDYPPVVVVNGTSLGTLDSGNVGSVKVTIPDITSAFPGQRAASGYVHQNSTYVAEVDQQVFTLTHTAANGAGFGTIVLNNVKPLSEIEKDTAGNAYDPAKLYDTVQAAVDEAKNGETIKVDGAVGSTVEYPITVTGRARTIYIDVTGNRKITKADNSNDVIISQPTSNSTVYTVQLTKDNNVVKPTEKPIPISVASAIGGAASLSASRADEGDTITVTLIPTTGYTVGGITVRTDTGASVSYTATGTNTYRFVVPTGAKSITVTPSFTRGKTGALVTVSSAAGGTATTSAGTNQVAAGSTVSVTTVPSSGYRTMGLSVTSNTGSATATRTGVNSYVFTVPAGATNVVVAPRFDVNNGTVFEDVWSTEYFSSAVAWAVGRGVTNGTDTYHFSPHNNCTRADMVTFLYRAAGSPAVGNVANPFWDVQPGSYYYNAVLWAVSKGITNGVSANQFGVNQLVTRAQAVTFLHRYNGSPAPASGNRFYDVPAREYYANAVAWATGKGVTNGTSTTLFSPNQAVTRAQAVAFLYRDFNNVRA